MDLTTTRLHLRNYRTDDWQRIHAYAADPDFSKYETWGPNDEVDTQRFVSEMIEENESKPRYKFDLAICLKTNGLLIGGCGIRRETELSQVANLGWAVHPDYQGQGYATEAARALIEFGFQKLHLSIIYALCDTRHMASYKVMEKLGMKWVGVVKGTTEVKGHIRDAYRYELQGPKR